MSKLCLNRRIFTRNWHNRSKQFYQHANQTQHDDLVAPLPPLTLRSRAEYNAASFSSHTSLLAAFIDAELYTEQWGPNLFSQTANRASPSFSQTVLTFSKLVDKPYLTSQEHKRASLATLKPFTTAALSFASAPSPQQTSTRSVSASSSQKPSYSKKTLPKPTTLARGSLPFCPPSRLPHPALPFSLRHPQASFFLFNNSCLTTPMTKWSSSFMMLVPPSTMLLSVAAPSRAQSQSKQQPSLWLHSIAALLPSWTSPQKRVAR